ncbi:MAG: beta-lactamase family protein [Clostridiales bacterium]|jgi:CubicO group peptidase (beta-lactamase class C family)|nr:beta-lactamase family protein [Clostridiales bacterium]
MNTDFLNNLDEYLRVKRYRLVNAVLVYENDNLVFERYYNKVDKNSRNQIKSVWKSILSLTLGVCLQNGIINSIDDPVCRYLPQFAQSIHPFHSFITIRHLLTMSSGIYWSGGVHYHCPMLEQMRRSKDWLAHIADTKMADYPGTKFVYKEWDVILLSALIGKASGSSAWEVCSEYLYKPLEIESARWTNSGSAADYPSWDKDTTSDLSARDMAKIGLITLRGGEWNGKQIVPKDYLETAVSASAASGIYGCLFWLSDKGYHCRGFGGQEVNIYPTKKTVAVVSATVTPLGKSYPDICEGIINA